MFGTGPSDRQLALPTAAWRVGGGVVRYHGNPNDVHLHSAAHLLAQKDGGQSGGAGSILFLLPLLAIFYFLIMRPQQKRVKEQRALLSAVKQGDRVVAAGGIVGTVRRVEDDTLSLQVADNVVIKVDKGSVSKRLSE
jgi:preprotein translocase subunit YajC